MKSNNGRYRLQMDLAVALMSHGVSLDWKDPTNDDKGNQPAFVRTLDWIPCGFIACVSTGILACANICYPTSNDCNNGGQCCS